MTNRGQFAQLLASGLTVRNFEVLEEWPEEYSQFLEADTDDGAYVEYQQMAGLGQVRLKPEGEPLTYDDPIQGGSIRAIHQAFGLGWICTMEMLADDKYGKIRQVPKELMPGLKHVVEQSGANLLNNGFTTVKTVDGLSLFNTAHPLLGGGTQSNQHATNSDFSQTALQDMVVMSENYTNERGLKRHVTITDLHIPPELQWVAKKVLNSELEAGTGNNDVNVVKGRVNINTRHYFTSTTAWFLSSSKTNYLRKIWRMKPQTEAADDFETKGVKHSLVARWSDVAERYEGWFASTGLGA
jgi:hypothetical protein